MIVFKIVRLFLLIIIFLFVVNCILFLNYVIIGFGLFDVLYWNEVEDDLFIVMFIGCMLRDVGIV